MYRRNKYGPLRFRADGADHTYWDTQYNAATDPGNDWSVRHIFNNGASMSYTDPENHNIIAAEIYVSFNPILQDPTGSFRLTQANASPIGQGADPNDTLALSTVGTGLVTTNNTLAVAYTAGDGANPGKLSITSTGTLTPADMLSILQEVEYSNTQPDIDDR